ncbi:hypothetical protein HanIR_Chr10g0494921 [Helianthus annuus]|nr:hypothetical protein HanIR_Chr10g0494921 [Helianthus annuus]
MNSFKFLYVKEFKILPICEGIKVFSLESSTVSTRTGFHLNRFDPYRFDTNRFDVNHSDTNRFYANRSDPYCFESNRFDANRFDTVSN